MSAEAFDFQRVEVIPADAGQGQSRVVERPAIGLVRLHLVEHERDARGPAVAADRATDVLAVGGANGRANGRDLDDDDGMRPSKSKTSTRGVSDGRVRLATSA